MRQAFLCSKLVGAGWSLLLGVHLRVQQGGVTLDHLRTDDLHGSGHQTVLLCELLRQDDELTHGFGTGHALIGLIDPLLDFGADGRVAGGLLHRHISVETLAFQPWTQRFLGQA